jgi:multidrug efflux pump subunit AcrB
VWGGALGHCVCAYLYPQIFAAVAATVLVVWTTYATLLTFVAAYFVPPHKKHEEESRRHERSTVEEVADWDVGIDKRVVLAASMTPTASQPQKAFGVVGSSVQQRSSHVGLSGKELILPPPRNQ